MTDRQQPECDGSNDDRFELREAAIKFGQPVRARAGSPSRRGRHGLRQRAQRAMRQLRRARREVSEVKMKHDQKCRHNGYREPRSGSFRQPSPRSTPRCPIRAAGFRPGLGTTPQERKFPQCFEKVTAPLERVPSQMARPVPKNGSVTSTMLSCSATSSQKDAPQGESHIDLDRVRLAGDIHQCELRRKLSRAPAASMPERRIRSRIPSGASGRRGTGRRKTARLVTIVTGLRLSGRRRAHRRPLLGFCGRTTSRARVK